MVNENIGPKVVYRVNNGGLQIPGSPVNWAEDKQGGVTSPYLDPDSYTLTTGSTSWSGVNQTDAPNNIFGGNRHSPGGVNMKWHFPVTNGEVKARLFFAISLALLMEIILILG